MTNFITWLRHKLGIKDRLLILTSHVGISEATAAHLQKELADELPGHVKVVVLSDSFLHITKL